MNCLKASLFAFTLVWGVLAYASDPELSYYIFRNKGNPLFGKIILSDDQNEIAVPADWFKWKCFALKQVDGVLMDCRHDDEFVETKVYCDLPQNKFGRLMRLGKGADFVTFEARCSSKIIAAKKPKPKSSIEEVPKPIPPTAPVAPVAEKPEVKSETPAAPEPAPVPSLPPPIELPPAPSPGPNPAPAPANGTGTR